MDDDSKAGGGAGVFGSTIGGSLGMSMQSKMGGSNLNELKQELEGQAPLESARAYNHLECTYLLSVLKNRAVQANNIKEHMFERIYNKSRATLKIQMKKLLLMKQFYQIDQQY